MKPAAQRRTQNTVDGVQAIAFICCNREWKEGPIRDKNVELSTASVCGSIKTTFSKNPHKQDSKKQETAEEWSCNNNNGQSNAYKYIVQTIYL